MQDGPRPGVSILGEADEDHISVDIEDVQIVDRSQMVPSPSPRTAAPATGDAPPTNFHGPAMAPTVDAPGVTSRPPPPPPPPPLPHPSPKIDPPPPQLGARFVAGTLLGTGGMGHVIEYEDTYLGRKVAVKALQTPTRGDLATMMEREARITGRLEHPNVIPVYDAGRDASAGPYYAMRVVKQPSLFDTLWRLRTGDPRIVAEYTQGRLLRIFLLVCNALEYAHKHGVVHCDLKPGNIMLGAFGEVLVADWGFAHEIARPSSVRGGTPGYMAPEQLDPRRGRIGPRSDVFALGAILYELLTLERAFPNLRMDDLVTRARARLPLFPPPATFAVVAPKRALAPELEEICMTALAFEPENRYPTAAALAEAVEAFMEGTKERERRKARAATLVEEGNLLAESHEDLVASNTARAAELARFRAEVPPWESAANKRDLWDAEDQLAVMNSIRIRTFQSAVAAFEHALDEVPGHAEARAGLARLYWGELRRAQQRRDDFDRVYFEGRVNEYDDGGFERKRAGSLVVDVPGSANVVLERLGDEGRRLQLVEEIPLGKTPIVYPSLDPGHYVVRIEGASPAPVRAPVIVRTAETVHVEVDPAEARDLGPGEVYVPGGPALVGGHDSSAFGRDPVELDVPSFAIGVFPVSFAEYLAFLADLGDDGTAGFARLLPRGVDRRPYWRLEGGIFVPDAITHVGGDEASWGALPVFGIDVQGAVAYAAWRSTRDGKRYRLPTELEWEKAARGTDGRIFPWGDRFDASFCKMRESRGAAASPEPRGAFATDVSPYGVRDMAGGVSDFAVAAHERLVVLRGGAWSDWQSDCHLAARRTFGLDERSDRVGFRLVRDLG